MSSSAVVLVVLLAVAVAALWSLLEGPAPAPVQDGPVYDAVAFESPSLDGLALEAFAWVVTRTFLGPVVSRLLLNDNGFALLRGFSNEHPLEPTFYPMERLKRAAYAEHVAAHEQVSAKLRSGDGMRVEPYASGDGKTRTTPKEKEHRYRSILDYNDVYASGAATPSEVLARVVAGVHALEPTLKAFSSFLPEDVARQAEASTARWAAGAPLSVFDGVPVVVKAMIDVKGHLIDHGGSQPVLAEEDDTLVAHFRKAGAVVLGATMMTEGGTTPLGYNSMHGGSFNPFDPKRYPGGSSSGSAVAVAAGLAPVGVGFDGGGSIRIPSALTGVFGLACTFGRVPFDGEALGFTTIKAGPLTATSTDAALAYAVMAAKAPAGHLYSRLYDGDNDGVPPARLDGFDEARADAPGALGDMRIGVFWDHFNDADPAVVALCREALGFLEARGATVVNITIPNMRAIMLAHGATIVSEFGLFWDAAVHNKSVALEANTRITIAISKAMTGGELLAAQRVRTWALQYYERELFGAARLDAIFSPASPIVAPELPASALAYGENNNNLVACVMRFINQANLLGTPAMSVPVGYDEDHGLPVAAHLMASHWQEHKLLRLARALEHGFLRRRVPPKHFVDVLADFL